MMRFLIDTHVLLWFITDDSRLSSRSLEVVTDATHHVFLSVASLWEIAIKSSRGKLHLGRPFETLFPHQLEMNGISILPIEVEHLSTLTQLPFHHRDPFDRVIIAQAIHLGIPLVSKDSAFEHYPLERIW